MSAPTITFRRARAAGACAKSYRKMARHVGGITRYGRDTPLPIVTVLDVLGLEDALWALDAAGYHRVLRLWACDCAERALPVFERAHPGDRRPREAVRVSRLYALGLATEAALAAAQEVSWAAASASASAASWDAAQAAAWPASSAASWYASLDTARAAAWAASSAAVERAWQTKRLRAYLEGRA